MKPLITLACAVVFIWVAAVCPIGCLAQEPVAASVQDTTKMYIVTKNDGTEFIGHILNQDAREVLIRTTDLGEIYIPKHEIKSVREISSKEMKGGQFTEGSIFYTRYFVTTNGLSMNKGDDYVLLNYYGPDFQFCVADNLSLGVMTSWFVIPIIGSVKYSVNLGGNSHLGLGVLAGTAGWVKLGALGVLPYASFTVGDMKTNLTFSGGFASITDGEGHSSSAPLFSIAGTGKLGKKISFVGDSFIYTKNHPFAIIIPGLRFSLSSKSSFQFGFGGVVYENKGKETGFPFPMLGWFVKI